jgi:hypothetical protein
MISDERAGRSISVRGAAFTRSGMTRSGRAARGGRVSRKGLDAVETCKFANRPFARRAGAQPPEPVRREEAI